MSRSKKKQSKLKVGKVCPTCGKGALERCSKPGKGHESHAVCKTCKFSNF